MNQNHPEVNLLGNLSITNDVLREAGYWDHDVIAAYGALGCFDQDSSFDLIRVIFVNSLQGNGVISKKLDRIFNETSGRGHGAVADHSYFTLSYKNVPSFIYSFSLSVSIFIPSSTVPPTNLCGQRFLGSTRTQ